MKKVLLVFLFFIVGMINTLAQKYTIVESTSEQVIVSIDFTDSYLLKEIVVENQIQNYIESENPILRNPGEPLLPTFNLNIGLPPNSKIKTSIIDKEEITYNNIKILPYIDDDVNIHPKDRQLYYDQNIYNKNLFFPQSNIEAVNYFSFRYSHVSNIVVSPYKYNPVSRLLSFYKKIKLKISFEPSEKNNVRFRGKKDRITTEFINSTLVNSNTAVNWQGNYKELTANKSINEYWYNSNKEYYKIFVDSIDLYRITYEDLTAAGFNLTNLDPNKIELYSNGEVVPIEVISGGDGIFGSGDYFQFLGEPPVASPYSKINIYNTENVYWLSFEGDESKQYRNKDGFPNNNFNKTFNNTREILHYERDSLYERLGHATTGERDFWQWGRASGQDGQYRKVFSKQFPKLNNLDENFSDISLRVNMHGMTTGIHKATIQLTSQLIGTHSWTAQTESTSEHVFSADTIGFFDENNIQVSVTGTPPPDSSSDEIRINWFEFEYYKRNRVYGDNYYFKSIPGETGKIRYSLSYWYGADLKIYSPDNFHLITNPDITNNQYKTVLFVDSISSQTQYFCASSNYFKKPLRIQRQNNSNLRDHGNGADYILLTHPDFMNSANTLFNFRKTNLKGFDNPRIKIVNIFDVYDEFAYGLLDPLAVREFVKYAFENWSGDAPTYFAILGDMSWDYRKIHADSRPNFVPSYPYHSTRFGLAASDNMYAAVAGTDLVPDLSVGRISCETPEEAAILVNKIINYPGDQTKHWKQNFLLIGAGESQKDEAGHGFNDQSLILDNNFIIPNGYTGEKIFAFPDENKPEHSLYLGNTPEIRDAFSRGTIMANFYGHGGGYQWDAVFLNDDIPLINNDTRLPFISSITCYTAHFDNQEVFGEQFNSIEGRGSIGFWGHTGVTFWLYGLDFNKKLYNVIFNEGSFVLGDAIGQAKINVGNVNSKLVKDHLALLTLLGDPALELAIPAKADFYVEPADISFYPNTPLTTDSVSIKIKINNIGRTFPGDSVKVEIFDQIGDSTKYIGYQKIANFRLVDSLVIKWMPGKPGLHNISVVINGDNNVDEDDVNDNSTSVALTVFNLDNPNIISPLDGSNWKDHVDFLFVDVGEFINKDLTYTVEIDTSISFDSNFLKSLDVTSNEFGEVSFQSGTLSNGIYFWRSRINDGNQFSNWSDVRTFAITDREDLEISSYSSKQLKLFKKSNLLYSDENESIILNLAPLPPKPYKDHFIEEIPIELPKDLHSLSAFTTDGTYFFVGHRGYYGSVNPGFEEESKIYKFGTGFSGTVKGQFYGELSPIALPIWKEIFYFNNGIYIATGDAHKLVRIETSTGDTSSVYIPGGMLNENSAVQLGAFYLYADEQYIYNIATRTMTGEQIYTLRILDPENNWAQVGEDVVLSGHSYEGFSSFFVADKHLYAYEKNNSGFLRRFSLDTYIFDDEWISNKPFGGYFSWAYDTVNDKVYASVFVNGNNSFSPAIAVFKGTYNQAFGSAVSPEIGPVSKWKRLNYSVDSEGSLGEYNVILEGLNTNTSKWDSLNQNFNQSLSIDTIDSKKYTKLRTRFTFKDTTIGGSQPMKLEHVSYHYESLPEIILSNNYLTFEDSLLQGIDVNGRLHIKNVGYSNVDSAKLNLYLNDSEESFFTSNIILPKDSIKSVNFSIPTEQLIFYNKVISKVEYEDYEFFTFNNLITDSFFVSRDSLKPEFKITFDGTEIINGDIISSKPNIFISLKDNSPLPIDTSNFFIYLNNNPVSFSNDSLDYSYTEYPNSEMKINWTPKLINGKHFLDVLAKDASDNFFDTTSYRVSFIVDTENKVYDIYNYPNPFEDETYFTFNISGSDLPEEMNVKIFTVAGRMIRDIEIPVSELRFGFNKFYWDGRDQDGNSIANGVYFCKFNIVNNGEYSAEIKKIAKLK